MLAGPVRGDDHPDPPERCAVEGADRGDPRRGGLERSAVVITAAKTTGAIRRFARAHIRATPVPSHSLGRRRARRRGCGCRAGEPGTSPTPRWRRPIRRPEPATASRRAAGRYGQPPVRTAATVPTATTIGATEDQQGDVLPDEFGSGSGRRRRRRATARRRPDRTGSSHRGPRCSRRCWRAGPTAYETNRWSGRRGRWVTPRRSARC